MEEKKKCPYNVVSLTLGIISILSSFFYYITYPAGILAIIFGVKGIKRTSSGIAKAGMILGIVGLSLATLIYMFMITLILLEI